MLDLERIRSAQLRADPFPYTVIDDAIAKENLADVIKDFPDIRHPGSIPISTVSYGEAFAALLAQLNGEALRQLIAEKFAVDLSDKPIMTTVRGVMRSKDGRIHTDSKTKVITILIYFNEDWQEGDGRLRILRNGHDIENFVEEIPPKFGTMLIFKVTDNCWHGHKPVVGKRLSLQMNYVVNETAKNKHQFFHNLSAKLKNLFH